GAHPGRWPHWARARPRSPSADGCRRSSAPNRTWRGRPAADGGAQPPWGVVSRTTASARGFCSRRRKLGELDAQTLAACRLLRFEVPVSCNLVSQRMLLNAPRITGSLLGPLSVLANRIV